MESRSLELYYGPCQIITVDVPRGERILPVHLNGIEITAERVLFHTKSFQTPITSTLISMRSRLK